MKLEDLERMIRIAVAGQSRPTLAAVAASGALQQAFGGEFADAVGSLSSRAKNPVKKPEDPNQWG